MSINPDNEVLFLKQALQEARKVAEEQLLKNNLPNIFIRNNIMIRIENGKETIIGPPEFPSRRINLNKYKI